MLLLQPNKACNDKVECAILRQNIDSSSRGVILNARNAAQTPCPTPIYPFPHIFTFSI